MPKADAWNNYHFLFHKSYIQNGPQPVRPPPLSSHICHYLNLVHLLCFIRHLQAESLGSVKEGGPADGQKGLHQAPLADRGQGHISSSNCPMGRPALFLPCLPSPSLGPDVPGKSYLSAFQLSFSMWFSGPSLSKEAMKRAEGWRAPESQHPHRWAIKR